MSLLIALFPFAVILLVVFGIRAVVQNDKKDSSPSGLKQLNRIEVGLIMFALLSIVVTLSFVIGWN